jgi:hypothetical protein
MYHFTLRTTKYNNITFESTGSYFSIVLEQILRERLCATGLSCSRLVTSTRRHKRRTGRVQMLYGNVYGSMLEPARPLTTNGTEFCRALLPWEKEKGDLLRKPSTTDMWQVITLLGVTYDSSLSLCCVSGETAHDADGKRFQINAQ